MFHRKLAVVPLLCAISSSIWLLGSAVRGAFRNTGWFCRVLYAVLSSSSLEIIITFCNLHFGQLRALYNYFRNITCTASLLIAAEVPKNMQGGKSLHAFLWSHRWSVRESDYMIWNFKNPFDLRKGLACCSFLLNKMVTAKILCTFINVFLAVYFLASYQHCPLCTVKSL